MNFITPEAYFASNHLNLVVIDENIIKAFEDSDFPDESLLTSDDIGKYFIAFGNIRSNFPLFDSPEHAYEWCSSPLHFSDMFFFFYYVNTLLSNENS